MSVLECAMSSDVVGWIRGPAQTLEQLWQAELIGRLRLREIMITASTLYLGVLFLRGRTTRAWRELAS